MTVPKQYLLGGLIVHQQRYRPSDSNKNVDIKLSAHDFFWNNFHQVRSTSKDWKAK
jgi:hypothetical protein